MTAQGSIWQVHRADGEWPVFALSGRSPKSSRRRRPADLRRLLHYHEARALEALHKPLRDDLRHDLLCAVGAPAAIDAQREGER